MYFLNSGNLNFDLYFSNVSKAKVISSICLLIENNNSLAGIFSKGSASPEY